MMKRKQNKRKKSYNILGGTLIVFAVIIHFWQIQIEIAIPLTGSKTGYYGIVGLIPAVGFTIGTWKIFAQSLEFSFKDNKYLKTKILYSILIILIQQTVQFFLLFPIIDSGFRYAQSEVAKKNETQLIQVQVTGFHSSRSGKFISYSSENFSGKIRVETLHSITNRDQPEIYTLNLQIAPGFSGMSVIQNWRITK